jgi:mitochondrial fission protein ELM1
LLGASIASVAGECREALLGAQPPDLTISAGHRSVPAVQALRRRSNATLRSIHVGFPRISPSNFDLVIATPQYPIADHPNVLRVPYALTRAASASFACPDETLLASLPQPRRLLIVGGPTLFWRLDEKELLATLAGMLDDAAIKGGSVLVTTSPRTPEAVEAVIAQRLGQSAVPTLLAPPGKPPGYASLLNAADSIRVTADSVSMVSDAIWSGAPLALVRVMNSIGGRLYMATMDRLRPERPVYPQDLRCFWEALDRIGVGQDLATPQTSTDDQMQAILKRVEDVLNR